MTPAGQGPLDVVVVDDDDLVRAVIVEMLEDDGRFDIVGVAGDVDGAVAVIAATRPSVVLLDVRMPGGGGARVAREARAVSPGSRIVALSSRDDRDAIAEMFRCGAVSYLVKGEASNEDIARTLVEVGAGQFSLPASIGQQVLDELATHLQQAHESESQRRAAEVRVRRVLHSQDVQMVFQPIFQLSDGRRVGAEALSRFHATPSQGPDRWFADAAAVGMGTALEMLAVRSALPALGSLDDDGYLALNVSPATATDAAFQTAVLRADPHRVVVEVTEHAPIDDYDRFQRSVEPLRTAGVRLAVDDAGAGFASLRHIVQLAPDIIKLDLSLTRDIDRHRNRRAMARALISFAAESGAAIVAEGIERSSELEVLRSLGVATGQGYLLARPAPLEQLPDTWAVASP